MVLKAAKHAVLGVSGPELSDGEREFLRRSQVGNIILFSRNIKTIVQINGVLRQLRELPTPPVVWIDQEGGRVQRLREPFTRYPSPMRITRLARRDPAAGREMARLMGELIGTELAVLGIGVDCAPVLDVQEEGADPVIGERAFGATPAEVVALAGAWLEGFAPTGVMAVGKHFPGHGAARADSHKSLPVVEKSRDQLEAWELAPFRALLDRLPCLMTAHLVATGVDDRPATWSPPWLQGVLRQAWGYDGLIASDAIEMGALTGTLAERAERSLRGGCDLVLCCTGRQEDNEATLEGLAQGLERLPAGEAEARQRRCDRLMQYRLVPGEVNALLTDPVYRDKRARLERLADEVLAVDPTEQLHPKV